MVLNVDKKKMMMNAKKVNSMKNLTDENLNKNI